LIGLIDLSHFSVGQANERTDCDTTAMISVNLTADDDLLRTIYNVQDTASCECVVHVATLIRNRGRLYQYNRT